MVCPKCGSENVTVSVVNEIDIKNQHHGVIWWVCIGWWWLFFKWLFLTVPALIVKIFSHKKKKVVNKKVTMCACQNCGYTWEK
jgi:predicted nucleic-acid-binding Zn-ribbon protein